MNQYEHQELDIVKPSANKKSNADVNRRITDLETTVKEQKDELHRMHRDIIRLRTVINALAGKIDR